MSARPRVPLARRLDDALVIKVTDGFDGGLFCVRSGVREDCRWIELSIHSSYGNYGYYFNNTGRGGSTVADFLGRVSRDYLMNKLVDGGNYMRFDADLTAKRLREWTVEQRRDSWGGLTKEEARELYDAIDDAEGEPERFMEALKDSCSKLFWKHDLWELSQSSPDPAAVQFYETLWPAFVTELGATDHKAEAA